MKRIARWLYQLAISVAALLAIAYLLLALVLAAGESNA